MSNFTLARNVHVRTIVQGVSNDVLILEIGSVFWKIIAEAETPPPTTKCVTRQIQTGQGLVGI